MISIRRLHKYKHLSDNAYLFSISDNVLHSLSNLLLLPIYKDNFCLQIILDDLIQKLK